MEADNRDVASYPLQGDGHWHVVSSILPMRV